MSRAWPPGWLPQPPVANATMAAPLDAALAYASVRVAVLPYHHPASRLPVPGDGGGLVGCSCGRPGCPAPARHPIGTLTLGQASSDAVQVADWFTQTPGANIATHTGPELDVVRLDPDGQVPPGRVLAWLDRSGTPLGPVLGNDHDGSLWFVVRPGCGGLAPGAALTPAGHVSHPPRGTPLLLPPSRTIHGASLQWLRPLTTIEGLPGGAALFETLRRLPDLHKWAPW